RHPGYTERGRPGARFHAGGRGRVPPRRQGRRVRPAVSTTRGRRLVGGVPLPAGGTAEPGAFPYSGAGRRAMTLGLRGRMPMAVAGGVVALALVARGCPGTSTGSGGTAPADAKIKGGTAVWALPPASAPNHI